MGRRPTVTYLGGAIVPALIAGQWIGENYLQLRPWWPDMPWEMGLVATGGLIVGLVVQDLYNARSWLRLLLGDASRLFVVESLSYDQPQGAPLRRESYALLRFVRDASKAEIRVWGRIGPEELLLVSHAPAVRLVKGDRQRVLLLTTSIHDPGVAPSFGALESGRTFYADEVKLVAIEVRAGLRRQRYRIQVNVRSPQGQWRTELIGQDQSPFDWPEP